MALLSLWSSNPDAVLSLTIEQIVATAGDGKLLDYSECSRELRAFLSQIQVERLAEYADHCLAIAFPKSGMVLQDLVNELGRRLDYVVTNGRYQGKSDAIGNDGLWHSPEGQEILIEVKTTDAYRISLDTIAGYRDQLRERRSLADLNSMLIVVGREDTGELEAQIRGSRHAWDMRVISIDALIRLTRLKESTEDNTTGAKIRSILVPMEYTRVDGLIDVLFTAAKDVESAIDTSIAPDAEDGPAAPWEFTDAKALQAKRDEVVAAFARKLGVKLVRKSRALYWDSEHTVRVVCTVSKRYTKKGQAPYWYAYHPAWDEFLAQAAAAYVVFGCMDLSIAFAIPVQHVRSRLAELNTTTRPDGTAYWHVKIIQQRGECYALQMPKSGSHVPLDEFVVQLGPASGITQTV